MVMIKAIIFDLDDTLLWDERSIKEAFVSTCKLAEARYGLDMKHLEEAVRETARELYASYDTYSYTKSIGISPFEGLWGDFLDNGEDLRKLKEIVPQYRRNSWTMGLQKLGIEDPLLGEELGEYFSTIRHKVPLVYEDTFSVLDRLKDKYQLVLLTNGSPHLQTTKLKLTPELSPYFNHIVISGDFGIGKPDASIFEYALSLLSLPKDEVIMVGDSLMTDILGANRAGLKSVWVNRRQQKLDSIIPTFEISRLEELFTLLEGESQNP
jgi:putative hydrolase of the HAD superfamily